MTRKWQTVIKLKKSETTTEVFDEGRDWLSALADLFFHCWTLRAFIILGKKWECEYYKSAQVAAFKKAGHLELGWLQDFEKNYPMYFNIGM